MSCKLVHRPRPLTIARLLHRLNPRGTQLSMVRSVLLPPTGLKLTIAVSLSLGPSNFVNTCTSAAPFVLLGFINFAIQLVRTA